MKEKLIILFISLFITCYFIDAQQYKSVDNWMEYVNQFVEETEDQERGEQLYEDLSYLSDHPFDLNEVTSEDLRQLPFLSDRQIAAFEKHRQKYGRFYSLYELKDIERWDYPTIMLVLPFVSINQNLTNHLPFTRDNLIHSTDQELITKYNQHFPSKEDAQQAQGSQVANSLRYASSFDDYIQWGIVTEKDSGEKWGDYYSAHFFMKDKGAIKSLALGDFKASFGQGLVMSQDFTLSRSALITETARHSNGFRRHYSTNETDYLRGGALTLTFGGIDVSSFYSFRLQDGRTQGDTILSLKTDGLHRSLLDEEKRSAVSIQTLGGNIRYALPDFYVGLTAIYYRFGGSCFYPEVKPYNLFTFRGTNNINMGVDYLWKKKGLTLFGESAFSKNGAFATYDNLVLSPLSYCTLVFSYRKYAKDYQAMYARSFGQNRDASNEEGVYMGLKLSPIPYWRLSAYADFFRIPWLSYTIDQPYSGREYMAQLEWVRKQGLSISARYKYREKRSYQQHKMRYQLSYQPIEIWKIKASADLSFYKKENTSKGLMLSAAAGWNPQHIPFQLDLYGAWFNTDNYFSRLYSYEKNLLYTFSMPSYYGKGTRIALSLRWDIFNQLAFYGKIGYSHYIDKGISQIESGKPIERPQDTEINALLRWKF